jgi:hypothetical protein
MAFKMPRVGDGVLCNDQTPESSILLNSPDWFARLEAPTSAGCQHMRHECWVTFPVTGR